MTRYAIRVENLGKEYVIGGAEQRHESFREMLTSSLMAPFRKMRKLGGSVSEQERFWALRDVSFDVEEGEVLGIIGRNGAGKSTLLKVLSRITSPTAGRVTTRGRVASLLEVGTGFHPELTGRENIFLNGAILGMSRVEIARRFEEIVSFADVEAFLDTPVKRYSSGMYVRLAFAVAAHLDVEILVVDEVLAVGDSRFQQKCLKKMGQISETGRTVLFVSHNMSAVSHLCQTAMLLDHGNIVSKERAASVIAAYAATQEVSGVYNRDTRHDSETFIRKARLEVCHRGSTSILALEIDTWSAVKVAASLDITLSDGLGGAVGFTSVGMFDRAEMIQLTNGRNKIKCEVDVSQLANGSYTVGLGLAIPYVKYLDKLHNCMSFDFERLASSCHSAVLHQAWGLGSVEFPVHVIR